MRCLKVLQHHRLWLHNVRAHVCSLMDLHELYVAALPHAGVAGLAGLAQLPLASCSVLVARQSTRRWRLHGAPSRRRCSA